MLSMPPPSRGLLLVVGGPSGVGKSTLIGALRRAVPGVRFSVSATTRAPRPGEVDGREYHFVDRAAFEAQVSDGAFLEWAEVYGNLYGTPRAPIDDALARGEVVLLDIDAQGTDQIRAHTAEAVHVMVLPPSEAVLAARLAGRGTEAPEVAARRLDEGRRQLSRVASYDYLVLNEDLDTATQTFIGIVLAELARPARRADWVAAWQGVG